MPNHSNRTSPLDLGAMQHLISVAFLRILLVFSAGIKIKYLLYSLLHAEACNEYAGAISASLRLGNTSPFKEMLQQRQAVGNTASDLTGPRFEPQTFRSREERDTYRPPVRCPTRIELGIIFYKIKAHLLFNIQAHLQDKYR